MGLTFKADSYFLDGLFLTALVHVNPGQVVVCRGPSRLHGDGGLEGRLRRPVLPAAVVDPAFQAIGQGVLVIGRDTLVQDRERLVPPIEGVISPHEGGEQRGWNPDCRLALFQLRQRQVRFFLARIEPAHSQVAHRALGHVLLDRAR